MNKKLLVALSVVGTLSAMVLASCKPSVVPGPTGDTEPTNTETVGPSIDPISDIEVDGVPETILVGDVIDLDTIFTVVGGSDPKGYEVKVRTASAEVCSVAGHVLTVLAEGPIQLEVTAGDESILVNWESLSATKALYRDATAGVTRNYSMIDLGTNSAGTSIVMEGTGNIHHPDYFYKVDDVAKKGEGMVLLSDGRVYDFEGDGLTCDNLEVLPGGESGANWEYYFVNMDFSVLYNDTVTVNETLETGEVLEYLELPSSVAVPSGMEDYANNMADYALLTSFGYSVALQSAAWKAQFNVNSLRVEIENLGTEAAPAFSLQWLIDGAGKYAGKTLYLAWGLLSTDQDDCSIAELDTYIAEGRVPEAIDVTPVTNRLDAIRAAKNYTLDVDAVITDKSGNEIDYSAYRYSSIFKVDQTTYVTEDSLVIADDSGAVMGIVKDGDTSYVLSQSEAGTKTATDAGKVVDVWSGEYDSYLVQPGSTYSTDDLAISKSEVEGGVCFSSDAGDNQGVDSNTTGFLYALLTQYALGSALINGADDFAGSMTTGVDFTSGETHSLSVNGDLTVYVYADTLVINYNWALSTIGASDATSGAAYLDLTFTYSNVGSTVTPDVSAFFPTVA